jgi:hypothetical protein
LDRLLMFIANSNDIFLHYLAMEVLAFPLFIF